MNKKAIVFDLDDTLAESKQPLDAEMAGLIASLIDSGFFVAVMSGGSFAQYKKQFLSFITLNDAQLQKLILIPTSGTAMYLYQNNDWQLQYKKEISAEDKISIIQTLHDASQSVGILPPVIYGEQIEDRDSSQITYSALGQNAPLTEKRIWDPDQQKRKSIVPYFIEKLPQFLIHIGGTTSIDVTQKGIDKTYGIQKLSEILSLPIEKMIFVGDALYPGGNDEPVKASGIECVPVKNVSDTKRYIRTLLEDK